MEDQADVGTGDRTRRWTTDDLLAALGPYEYGLTAAGLKPISIRSFVDYARRFLRWRMGEYRPRSAVGPPHARPDGHVDVAALRVDLGKYETDLREAQLLPHAIRTYVGQAGRFVRWLDGSSRTQDQTTSILGQPNRTAAVRRPRAADAARRPNIGREGASLERAQVTLGNLVAAWRSAGKPPQPGIGWSQSRWQAALPQHAVLFHELPNPLDRAALVSMCGGAVSDVRSAETAFVAVMVWGQGNNGYAQYRTTQILANTPRSADRLLEVARTVQAGGAMDAYRRLGDDCRLAGLGPAFGTKFLHFCQPPGQAPRALIFDKTVSEWIADNTGFELSPLNWSEATYSRYLRQMHDWAASLGCLPEDIEMCIFRAMARIRKSQWNSE